MMASSGAKTSTLPIEVTHDEIVHAARAAVANVSAAAIGSAFVSALRPRRFEHWSSLASYAFARALPEHAFLESRSVGRCATCGACERVAVFESGTFAKQRASGAIATDLRYALYDLQCFTTETFAEPGDDDRRFFTLALSRIGASHALGTLFSSRLDRRRFVGVLQRCGILVPRVEAGKRAFGIDRGSLHAFGLSSLLGR
jgi:hypothetical protein